MWYWLIFAYLPRSGVFTNGDVYAKEAYFQDAFPHNHHIRGKIRQVLIRLAADGRIVHVGRGRWARAA